MSTNSRKCFLLIANLLFELSKSPPLSGTPDDLTIQPNIDKRFLRPLQH